MKILALALMGCALSAPALAQSGIVSDDFNEPTLGAHWTHVDPLGDTSLALEGYGTEDARVVISIPAGQNHDMWAGANHAPRILQNCNDVDFEVEVKFDSSTVGTYTSQGIIVQESADTFLRFEFLDRPNGDYLFEASIVGASASVLHQKAIDDDPRFLRVNRTGDIWCVSYSYDGTDWEVCSTVNYALVANQIGLHATSTNFGAPAVAFESRVDYFFDTSNRITPEDGPVDTEIPISNAGVSRAIHAGDVVYLDGSGSADDTTSTDALTYQWSLLTKPSGSTSALIGADTIAPSFASDATGAYLVQLIVTDAAGFSSEPSVVEISSLNLAPTADAGGEQLASIGEAVVLDGLDSFDPEADTISYAWSFTSIPAGSQAILMDADTATPSFSPDEAGDYAVQLIASDAFADSDPDEVTITAVAGTDTAIQKLRDLARELRWEPSSKFAHRWHKRWMRRHLRHSAKRIQQGHLLCAEWSLTRILRRTDGYALRGSSDGFSWWWSLRPDVVTDQELQLHIYETVACALSLIQAAE